MAIEPITFPVPPKFTHVESYTVNRLGPFPQLRVRFEETVYRKGTSTDQFTWNWDPHRELLVSDPTWYAMGMSLQGRYLTGPDNEQLGSVASVTVTPEHLVLVLAGSVGVTTLPTTVYLVEPTPKSPMSYTLAQGGKTWVLALTSQVPVQAAKMDELLGTVHIKAVAEVLTVLGMPFTIPQLQGAVIALGANGRNIDTYLAEAGEQLELERRAGTGVAILVEST